MNLNKLQQKIQEFLKSNDLDKLKDNYREPTTNDDFVDYQPLTQDYINSLDDSINKQEELIDYNSKQVNYYLKDHYKKSEEV